MPAPNDLLVFVTANLFNMLGRPRQSVGTFAAASRAPVVHAERRLLAAALGRGSGIVGKPLTLSGTTFQVIGVMPPDFVFPYPGMLGPSGFTRVTGIDMWVPISFSGPMARGRTAC